MNNAGFVFSADQLRPSQLDIVRHYQGGRLGISAVPGSGKTYTLSYLAANLIISGQLNLRQEVLIVTLSNSAVDNFTQRIGSLIQSDGLMTGMSYRVRTLHGLAHDIVRERPSLVGLANDFSIIDEGEAARIREHIATAWLRANPYVFDAYLNTDFNDIKLEAIRANELPRMVRDIGQILIRYAKDQELTPETLAQRLENLPGPLPLAQMGLELYQEYQRSLNYRGAVDFDDLIRLALVALRSDPRLLERLQRQWPYILEDEAQDSSRLQEEILRLLAGDDGNWVRVGDPNQAIYETFTTANPQHLIDFIHAPGVVRKELPVSSRSTLSIIQLANYLVDWTRAAHPLMAAREALHPPRIQPASPRDLKPNPPDDPTQIALLSRKLTPGEEMDLVINRLVRWQEAQDARPESDRETLAVLDMRNERGAELANALRKKGLDPVEILGTTAPTRLSAGALTHILRSLANPQSAPLLERAFRVWRRTERGDATAQPANQRASEKLKSIKHVENFLYPLPGQDWLDSSGLRESDPEVYDLLVEYREVVQRWHGAALLPIDQAVLTVAQDLFCEPADLAIAHKLASVLRQTSDTHPTWRLPELSKELETIARNKRRFLGFSEDDSGFDPERYRGRIVITTLHKAKGLEWDRVYLLSANNYNFPSGAEYDQYYSEKWYIREQLNLEAEALEQLKTALSHDEYSWYEEGTATQTARLDCIRERLRLLYVGITRAKKALVITWNTGRKGDLQPALPYLELQNFWEREIV